MNSQISAAREEYKLGVSEEELLRQRIADKAARSNTEGQLKWQKRQEKLRGFGETVSSKVWIRFCMRCTMYYWLGRSVGFFDKIRS